jgi:hypothetical protein
MLELKTAITIVEIIVGIGAAMVLGDYLGYKVGRWKLASVTLITVLVVIVAFAIYAAVLLTGK